MLESEKLIVPEFPRTAHLPIEPNAEHDDIIASDSDLASFLNSKIFVEEKIDATNLGVALVKGEPIVRNRAHILRKGYSKCKTPAQIQYQRFWSWFYDNINKWRNLNKELEFEASVYGEWLYARHVVEYNALPSLFIAYDIYNSSTRLFLPPEESRRALLACGFEIPQLLGEGIFTTQELISLRDGDSKFSSISPREGIYLKSSDGTQRYKMVSPWFKSDDNWNKKPLIKNQLGKIAK
jgi:atypical dual specificity phosphatase